jgi:hypothetical protein
MVALSEPFVFGGCIFHVTSGRFTDVNKKMANIKDIEDEENQISEHTERATYDFDSRRVPNSHHIPRI